MQNGERDPFNQNFRPVRPEKVVHLKGGTSFSKLFRLDRTEPLSFQPKFREILAEWIAPPRVRNFWRLSPVSLSVFSLLLDLLFDCSRILEYAKI